MGGAPIINGTRTPIEVILYQLKEGNSLEAIHEMYPWIDVDALSWTGAHSRKPLSAKSSRGIQALSFAQLYLRDHHS